MTTNSTEGHIPVGGAVQRFALAVSSGLMLGLAFPPSPLYSLAYVGLIPFLLLVETHRSTWQILRSSYVALFVFHAMTVSWAGGFTHGRDPWMMAAGAALILFHPLFYLPSILLFVLARRRLGPVGGLASFPFFWISYEYLHSLGEFSFPWITLGNSQAYDLYRSQIVEYTSTYGLSLLIIAFNVVAFFLVVKLVTGQWNFRSRYSIGALAVLLIIYFGPWLYGKIIIARFDRTQPPPSLKVGIVQPNVDPWEKWGGGYTSKQEQESYMRQLSLHLNATKALAAQSPDLVIWSETAIPFRILLPQNLAAWARLRSQLDSIGVPVFTGLPFTTYYDSATAPITANRIGTTNAYYADFNSAALLVPGQSVGDIYEKIVLVPYAERIPYAEAFRFLIEPLKWNVGIGMWGLGKDTVVFSLPTNDKRVVKFSGVICYESAYPNFMRQFVRNGAEFLVVITNDSWWGNTSGAYQHVSFASFRAIENRRWVVQAANGGISALVDPLGRVQNETKLYTSATILGAIEPNDEQTFYARHGDVFALGCLFCAALFLILTFVGGKKHQNE